MHAPIGCGASPGVPARGRAAAEAECAPIRTTWHPGPGGTGWDGVWVRQGGPEAIGGLGHRDRAVIGAWNRKTAPPIQAGGLQEPLLAVWGLDVTVCIGVFRLTMGSSHLTARRDSERSTFSSLMVREEEPKRKGPSDLGR